MRNAMAIRAETAGRSGPSMVAAGRLSNAVSRNHLSRNKLSHNSLRLNNIKRRRLLRNSSSNLSACVSGMNRSSQTSVPRNRGRKNPAPVNRGKLNRRRQTNRNRSARSNHHHRSPSSKSDSGPNGLRNLHVINNNAIGVHATKAGGRVGSSLNRLRNSSNRSALAGTTGHLRSDRRNKLEPGSNRGPGQAMARGRDAIAGSRIARGTGHRIIAPGGSAEDTADSTFLARRSDYTSDRSTTSGCTRVR